MSNEEQNPDGEWGWEALGSEDGNQDNDNEGAAPPQAQSKLYEIADVETKILPIKNNISEKSLVNKKSYNTFAMSKAIPSSPSFQELEKAIGAELQNSGYHPSYDSLKSLSPSNSFSFSRVSSTNITQQKLHQQRLRQQQQNYRYQQYNTRQQINHQVPLGPSARTELAPFINESESRAIILFHSPHVASVTVRNCCSKFGVLYYIRPEFHGRGVTLISYFDLRAATAAKVSIAEDLGADSEAAAHYSIMLHATNSNTEEFRLVVKFKNPSGTSESEIQSIFARYGQLRSIEKTFTEDIGSGSSEKNTEKKNENSVPVTYSIEYFNIQDARLAVSELSATSLHVWGPDTTVGFAPLNDRKQQLCRQLLATLSKWRTEMSNGVQPLSPLTMIRSPQTPVLYANNGMHLLNNISYPPMMNIQNNSPMQLTNMNLPNNQSQIVLNNYGSNINNNNSPANIPIHPSNFSLNSNIAMYDNNPQLNTNIHGIMLNERNNSMMTLAPVYPQHMSQQQPVQMQYGTGHAIPQTHTLYNNVSFPDYQANISNQAIYSNANNIQLDQQSIMLNQQQHTRHLMNSAAQYQNNNNLSANNNQNNSVKSYNKNSVSSASQATASTSVVVERDESTSVKSNNNLKIIDGIENNNNSASDSTPSDSQSPKQ
jgi:hypothetical protein